MNVYLIGYRGTGKSTLARALAPLLGWNWLDADDLVERQAGKSIAEVFSDDGEQAFRDLETVVVRRLADEDRTVVALGGGAILRAENREALASGLTVWLQAGVETIARRVHGDPSTSLRRPNLTTSGGVHEIRELLRKRTPIYRESADLAIDTDGRNVEDLAVEVVQWLATRGVDADPKEAGG